MSSKTPAYYKREKRRSEMFNIIADYEASGLTQQAFIDSISLTRSRFYYWLGRYRADRSPRPSKTDFIPVKVTRPVRPVPTASSELEPTEIHLPDGTRIVLDNRTPAGYLRELLHGTSPS